ncbi:MAG: mannosyltransferase family protein [Egibacteraceae bacterium]
MSVDVRGERVDLPPLEPSGVARAGRWLLRPVAAYVVSRLVVLAAVAYGVWSRNDPSVLRALAEWDGSWYLSAAVQGYPSMTPVLNGEAVNSNLAFFPLYPTAVRGMSAITGISPLLASVVVAFLGGLTASVLLWLLVRRLCDQRVADRAVLLFCFFPGSVVFSMAYSESLMLTMAMVCLLALLDRRWVAAGVAGALATASRPNAIAICACCLYPAARAVLRDRDWRALIAPLLAPAGFVGFMLFLWARTGDPLVWFRVQSEGWNERFDWGRRTLEEVMIVARDPVGASNTMTLQVLGLVFVLIALYFLWRWRPPAVIVIYTVGVLGLCLGSWTLGARPRFVLTAFPLIVAVARAARGRWFAPVLGVSALGMWVLAVMYTAPGMAVP